jgi:dienelactone hydrolase
MTTDFSSVPLVHSIAGTADVAVERDHLYLTEQGPLGFDLYRPAHANGSCPAVVFVTGLADPDVIAMFGKPLKDCASSIGWARLVAASGLAGITYRNRTPADVAALIRHVRVEASTLGIDPARIAVWACSGHVPNALGVIARERIACAALLYGYLPDLERGAEADAAMAYFATPPVSIDELPRSMPMLIVRAGKDATPGLDERLQRFVATARAHSLAVTLIDHAEAPHAFDLVDDSPATHAVIDDVLAFLVRVLA